MKLVMLVITLRLTGATWMICLVSKIFEVLLIFFLRGCYIVIDKILLELRSSFEKFRRVVKLKFHIFVNICFQLLFFNLDLWMQTNQKINNNNW